MNFIGALCVAQTLKGGWLRVEFGYDNVGDKTSTYDLTIITYGSSRPVGGLMIWDAGTNELVRDATIKIDRGYGNTVSNIFSPCPNTGFLNNIYSSGNKPIEITLPTSTNGYIVAQSYLGRDTTCKNIYDPANTGILFRAFLPGTINGMDCHKNSTPDIDLKDTVSVCINTYFSFRVTATDRNGDSLAYRFGDAIQMAFDTTPPPDFPVQYNAPCSGSDPFGTGVSIDPVTGVVSGIAPLIPGGYNIAVYIEEWRNGILINTTRKESQIKVVNCPFTAPLLKPLYSSCRVNTFTFKNEATCPDITSWEWDFGDASSFSNTSVLAMPTHTYPGSGTYILKLKVANNYGYTDSAKSIVKILNDITVKLNPDTAICRSDTITLKPVSEATSFLWKESSGGRTLSNYNIQYPKGFPSAIATTYYVTGQLNNCKDSAKITVYTSPYPIAKAGADTIICIGKTAVLNAGVSGSIFSWSTNNTIINNNTLQVVVRPQKTTAYVLSVRDTFYCPKIVKDTVVVKVVPTFRVSAGDDQTVFVGQPIQLNAVTEGNTEIVSFLWQPSSYLNYNNISNPVATIHDLSLYTIPFTVTATTVIGGCSVSDEMLVKVFKNGPDILMPNAFSPNGDGKNDVLKPILIGMKKLDYFTVYNRFGQVVFTTSEKDRGWDGNIKGIKQDVGIYAIIAKGRDYLGNIVFKKGTVMLLR